MRWHSASFGHVLWKQLNRFYESRPQENEDVRPKNPIKTVGEIRTQSRDMNLQCWRDFLSNNSPQLRYTLNDVNEVINIAQDLLSINKHYLKQLQSIIPRFTKISLVFCSVTQPLVLTRADLYAALHRFTTGQTAEEKQGRDSTILCYKFCLRFVGGHNARDSM